VLRVCLARCNRRKNRTLQKPLRHRHFCAIKKISRASLRNRAVHVVVHSACASRDARCGVSACSLALHRAKTLVFLPRCSNPNAVLAIPVGTGRYRHSLTARRAAWRRSEGRRRRQRKRARRRPSAGRRSKRAPRISLRLRTTSMTASNGPARVEQRRVHRVRHCRPSRRLRASARQGLELHHSPFPRLVKKRRRIISVPRHSTNSAAGLVAPALADALGIFQPSGAAPGSCTSAACSYPLNEYLRLGGLRSCGGGPKGGRILVCERAHGPHR
jgi:hypothetical protein